jgi:aerotaxis receptor
VLLRSGKVISRDWGSRLLRLTRLDLPSTLGLWLFLMALVTSVLEK